MPFLPAGTDTEKPVSVSQLTDRIKDLLETTFPSVWVVGEISNFARPRSGHCYLTLKDEHAQIPAVLWRNAAARVRFELHDGLEVVCRGQLGVYPPHGKYQLILRSIEPAGLGALELALRQTRDKLQREGLFDPTHKQPLPRFPRRVAVVTSPTGAAIRDFLEVLRRRWPATDVLVVPVPVQGEGAALQIARAIETVNQLATPIDCLVVTRGGGSLEDLWAFNEEVVCRAIFASRIPVISAIGHEIDVSLSDLVADVRALTPSEAAERLVPSINEITRQMHQWSGRMDAAARSRLAGARVRLDAAATCRIFRRPAERLHDLGRRLDDLAARSDRAVSTRLRQTRQTLDHAAARIESLSPLAVLARGYSLTERVADNQIVRIPADVTPGDQLRTRLADGEIVSRVE